MYLAPLTVTGSLTTRTVGEDASIFATALETSAVKAFGDMGQTARLRLIRDRFIAGHSIAVVSCGGTLIVSLRRPPIRDVVDRCRIWESHADPAARWVSKPSPDQTYPAYVVGDSDSISETGPDQLEDLLRR